MKWEQIDIAIRHDQNLTIKIGLRGQNNHFGKTNLLEQCPFEGRGLNFMIYISKTTLLNSQIKHTVERPWHKKYHEEQGQN